MNVCSLSCKKVQTDLDKIWHRDTWIMVQNNTYVGAHAALEVNNCAVAVLCDAITNSYNECESLDEWTQSDLNEIWQQKQIIVQNITDATFNLHIMFLCDNFRLSRG